MRKIRDQLHPFRGEMLTLNQIAERTDIPRQVIYRRMYNRGVSAEEAVALGAVHTGRYMYHGEMLSMAELARRAGIECTSLGKLIKKQGISAEAAVDLFTARIHSYEGEMCSLKELSERSGVALSSIRFGMERYGKEPVQIVQEALCRRAQRHTNAQERSREVLAERKAEMAALEAEARTPEERCARQLAKNMYGGTLGEIGFKQLPDGHFEYGSQHYLFRVDFQMPKHATLTAIFRGTDKKSMVRKYRYSADGKPVEIERNTLLDARLLHRLQQARMISYSGGD